jgi:hypothetical protein
VKLSVNFQNLVRLRESINAPIADVGEIVAKRSFDGDPIERKLIELGSIILSGTELDEVLHFPGGLAAIGNTQITLHIFQPFASLEELQEIPSPKPRYHVADCTTLDTMRTRGRFDRYVSTADADGYFRLEPWDSETQTRGKELQSILAPCQNCLKFLNYDGFEEKNNQEKRQIVSDFDISKFFENYEPIFRCLPLFNADNFPEGNYTADWARVSEEIRQRANWKCKECGVDLNDNRNLLHAHHLDGNRGNNDSKNLRSLCCVCHQKEPFHEQMYIKPEDKKTILRLLSE